MERKVNYSPIFIIGKNRSGTKWLSNIVSNNSQICSVQRSGAGGLLETNMFHQYPEVFGNLKDEENYCAMAACFLKSNFFQCTGLDESILFNMHPCSYLEFFRTIMYHYKQKEGKPHWLQKSNPLELPSLYTGFPDAKFIIITRNPVDNIRSAIGLARLRGVMQPSLVKESTLYSLSRKISDQYSNKENVLRVTFEELKKNRRETLERVCAFLQIPFENLMLQDIYEKNTSFQKAIKRKEILSQSDLWRLKVLCAFADIMPVWLLVLFRKRFGANRNPDRSRFIHKTFSMLRVQYQWEKRKFK